MHELLELLENLQDYSSLRNEIAQLRNELEALRSHASIPVLVPEKQIGTELNLCSKTLRKYRYQNLLPYTKIGNRIFYDRNKIMESLQKAQETDPSIRISSKLSSAKKRLFWDTMKQTNNLN